MRDRNTTNAVLNFLKNGKVWDVPMIRPKTRSACIEVLCRLPDSLRKFILESSKIALVATRPGCAGQVFPCATFSGFNVIILPEVLERAPYFETVLVIVKCIAGAVHSDPASKRTPEEWAIEWGFEREVSLSKKRNAPKPGGSLAEVLM